MIIFYFDVRCWQRRRTGNMSKPWTNLSDENPCRSLRASGLKACPTARSWCNGPALHSRRIWIIGSLKPCQRFNVRPGAYCYDWEKHSIIASGRNVLYTLSCSNNQRDLAFYGVLLSLQPRVRRWEVVISYICSWVYEELSEDVVLYFYESTPKVVTRSLMIETEW